jgi:hypothetical protein
MEFFLFLVVINLEHRKVPGTTGDKKSFSAFLNPGEEADNFGVHSRIPEQTNSSEESSSSFVNKM